MHTKNISTFNFKEVENGYSLISDNKLIYFTPDGTNCIIGNSEDGYDSFLSKDKKIFLEISSSQFHLLYDTLGTILYLFEQDKDTLFILNINSVNSNKLIDSLKDFFFMLLDYHSIKYKIYSNNFEAPKLNANNFYNRSDAHIEVISNKAPTNITKYVKPFIKNKDIEPYRKIYLSRKIANSLKDISYGSNDLIQINKKLFDRIDDEEKLEKYFSENGFEIVYPEKFESFEEQLNFFYEVKTVVSLSGAGLSNAIFMQQGSNVIELLTYHYVWRPRYENEKRFLSITEEEHFFYVSIALEKGLEYIAINNKEQNADMIINKINQNTILKGIFQ